MKNFLATYKNIIKGIAIAGTAYVTGLALAIVNDYGITGIESLLPCLIALAAVVYYKAIAIWKKQDLKYAVPLGFIFALTLVVGSNIAIYDGVFEDISVMDIACWPFLGLFFTAAAVLLFDLSDKVRTAISDREIFVAAETRKKTGAGLAGKITAVYQKHPYLLMTAVYLVCYLPYYLTFFPGNCGPDTWESVRMILGEIPWTNHHPVLFTGLLMVVIKATGFLPLTGSIGVFSFLQMLSLAAVMAYVTVRIFKLKTPVLCKVFAVGMFAFHPFMGMYSIYLTKDVIFAEIMVILCLKIYDVISVKGETLAKPSECVKLALLFMGTCMLRNNGLYIAIIMAVIFLVLYKKYWKQILLIFVCVIGLFKIWQGPVFTAIGIEKQSFAEAASVPLQQVGYVLWEGGTFSDEDMVFLEELMPAEKVKEVYQPGYTDPYKFDEDFNDTFLNDNVGAFLNVWWNGCKEHFGSYVKAYLMQTVGYWHYGETNSVCTQGISENTLGVEQVDVIQQLTGISLEPVFEKLVLAGRKAPLVCMLGSMAMQMLAVFLLTIQYGRGKKAVMMVWLMPLMLLWITIMIATPAFCLLRYLFPVFLLWPVLIADFFAADVSA